MMALFEVFVLILSTVTHLTTSVTLQPTPSPVVSINPTCASAASNLDIIFLVDTSCALTTDECTILQEGISDLIATIKQGSEPRVAYIEFADDSSHFVDITLDDALWNNDAVADDSMVRQEYAQYVSNIPCYNYTVRTDTLSAIDFAQTHFKVKETGPQITRDKRIVLINGCVHEYQNYSTDPCDALTNGELMVYNKEIEVTLININDFNTSDMANPATYLSCLTTDEPERLFPITDLTYSSFSSIFDEFAQVVCEPDTDNPTIAPSENPTAVTAGPTTSTPTTSMPTTSTPTTDSPTTAIPTTDSPTTTNPTTNNPTTSNPTINPTTSGPTTSTPTTSNPTSDAPTTSIPTTSSPTTSVPTTFSPTTSLPTTSQPSMNPTSSSPTTSNPTPVIPTTASPSLFPTTNEPTTDTPTTDSPTTDSPTTDSPTTNSPTTNSPTTQVPTTDSPSTDSPTTTSPTTDNPTTASPTTPAPTTSTPTSSAPTTNNPTPVIPTTAAPSVFPTTNEPTTNSPTTDSPTTDNPTTTAEPSTSNPTTSSPTNDDTSSQPTTSTPTSSSVDTDSPTTSEPSTSNPTTDSPTTATQNTENPTTFQPTTSDIKSSNPTTIQPTTDSPTTSEPTTSEPTTSEPTTSSPSTNPTTSAPSTMPTTSTPTTSAPTASSTGCDESCKDEEDTDLITLRVFFWFPKWVTYDLTNIECFVYQIFSPFIARFSWYDQFDVCDIDVIVIGGGGSSNDLCSYPPCIKDSKGRGRRRRNLLQTNYGNISFTLSSPDQNIYTELVNLSLDETIETKLNTQFENKIDVQVDLTLTVEQIIDTTTTEPIKDTETSSSDSVVSEIYSQIGNLIIAVCLVLSILLRIFGALYDHNQKGSDTPNYLSMFMFFVAVANLYTNIIVCFVLFAYHKKDDYSLFIAAGLILLFTHIASILFEIYFMAKATKNRLENPKFKHNNLLLITTILCMSFPFIFGVIFVGFHASCDLLTSKLFYRSIFSLQLSNLQKFKLSGFRLIHVGIFQVLLMMGIEALFFHQIDASNVYNLFVMISFCLNGLMLAIIIVSLLVKWFRTQCICCCRESNRLRYKVLLRSESLKHNHLYSHRLIEKCFAQCLQINNLRQIETVSIRNIDGTNDISIHIEIKVNNFENTNKFENGMNELNDSSSLAIKTMKSAILTYLTFDPVDLRMKVKAIDIYCDMDTVQRQLSGHMRMSLAAKQAEALRSNTTSPDGPKPSTGTTMNSTLLEMPTINANAVAVGESTTKDMETPLPMTPISPIENESIDGTEPVTTARNRNSTTATESKVIIHQQTNQSMEVDEEMALTAAAMNSWVKNENDGSEDDQGYAD